MIHYQLRCGGGHEFEGWFKDSAAFDKQAAHHLLSCPQCGSEEIHRALMAPALHSGGKRKGRPARVEAEPQAGQIMDAPPMAAPMDALRREPPAGSVAGVPDAVRAVLQRIRQEVEARCDDVGDRFAEEALRIHRGETEERGIYGKATLEEHEALADEGVEVFQLPWIPRSDA